MISSGEIWRREMQQMKIERAIEIFCPSEDGSGKAYEESQRCPYDECLMPAYLAGIEDDEERARKMQHGGMRR